jgi:hypothetical protein
MASFTNPDGSSTECNLVGSVPGEKELVDTTQEDCMHDFTCEYADTGWQTNVQCHGKMNVYHYKQVVTNYYICVQKSDCIYLTYPDSEKVTNTWTENGNCIMQNGRSCCPDGSLPIGGPPDWPPPGWAQPVIVGPDEPNPFK